MLKNSFELASMPAQMGNKVPQDILHIVLQESLYLKNFRAGETKCLPGQK